MLSNYLRDAYFWFIDNLNNIATVLALVISVWGFVLRLIDRRTKIKVETKDEIIYSDDENQMPLENILRVKITNQTRGRDLVIDSVYIEWGIFRWPTLFWNRKPCPIFDFDDDYKTLNYIEDELLPHGRKPFEFETRLNALEYWLYEQRRLKMWLRHYDGKGDDDYEFVTIIEAIGFWLYDILEKLCPKSLWVRIVVKDTWDNLHQSKNKFQIDNIMIRNRSRLKRFNPRLYTQYYLRNVLKDIGIKKV